jgi:hypothetical protein
MGRRKMEKADLTQVIAKFFQWLDCIDFESIQVSARISTKW